MIVNEVSSLFLSLLKDYSNSEINSRILAIINLLNARTTQNSQQVLDQLFQIRSDALNLTEHNAIRYRAAHLREFIEKSPYQQLRVDIIAKKIFSFIPDQLILLPTSGQVQAYLAELQSLAVSMSSFIQVAGQLGDTELHHADNCIFLVLKLPGALFSNELGELADTLNHFDRFVSGVHQLATSDNRKPVLSYTSSSDFLYYIQYSIAALPAFIPIFDQCLSSAEKLFKVLTALSILRQANTGQEEALEKAIDSMNRTLENSVEAALQSITKTLPDNGSQVSIEAQIKLSSNYVVKRLSQGASLSFDVRGEQDATVLIRNIDTTADFSKPLDAIEDQTNRQLRLSDDIAAAKAPVLLGGSTG